ncbi:MAG: hypothetical protein ACLPLP_02495 [Mycobacterium sp.]
MAVAAVAVAVAVVAVAVAVVAVAVAVVAAGAAAAGKPPYLVPRAGGSAPAVLTARGVRAR